MPPEKHDDVNALRLISDILDKLIETQQATSETNANLKASIDTMVEIVKKIESHFSNGFKSDIKNHIDNVIKEVLKAEERNKEYLLSATEERRRTDEKAQKIIDTLSKPGFWIKLSSAILIAVAGLATAIVEIVIRLGR